MLNTASVSSPVLHHRQQHVVQHHRPSQQNALSSLVDPAARAAAIHKLQQLQLEQLQQVHEQQLLHGSPPYETSSLERIPSSAESDAVPSTSTSASTSPPSSSKGGSDADHLKDSIRHVEELMKAPQQAHSAIQKIHKGQRISGMDQDAFVRARKIKSPCSAFAEVAEIKLIVYQLLLAPQAAQQSLTGIQALLNHANLHSDSSSSPLHNNNNGLNGHTNGRKRSANFGSGGGPSQPEQPVALRPAPCGLTNGAFVPQWPTNSSTWSLFQHLRNTSPTLPGAAPTTETASAGDNKPLWSSPSSVESGHKPESNAGDSNIDPVGMESDGSPTSSCTQSPADVLAFAAAAVQNSAMSHVNGGHERKPRKQISDDYVKMIRQQHESSGKEISDIQIPVPEALECDPTFTAVPEQQIVNAIKQNKKLEEMNAKDVQEATTQLCKKLAEKRVFGPRLMAQTTVAGPNHSTYNNLPDEGIIYIQNVCRRELGGMLKTEEEFWDVFREAMRKLAARCRRVRHAKKTKSAKEANGVITLPPNELTAPLAFLSQDPRMDQWLETVKANQARAVKQELSSPQEGLSPQESILQLLQQNGLVKNESPEEPAAQPQMSPEEIAEWAENIRRAHAAASAANPLNEMIKAATIAPHVHSVFQDA
ncbi:hypothetical protein PENTCL1PPCAC_29334 [Pristionchus entomophagus]|uniref:Uncharacterized protein n=1 Tax=Pristionchus entomophagus TaxID=358040 RepID=A0AAV5UJD7_9BILA|nr:hypothetical protein PENTCL1PPCAC_29334 [Pristionchus entomophagus]